MNKRIMIVLSALTLIALIFVAVRLAAPPASLAGKTVEDVVASKSSNDGAYRADVIVLSGGATVGSSTFVDLIWPAESSATSGRSRVLSFTGKASLNLTWTTDRILLVEYAGDAPTRSIVQSGEVVINLKRTE